MRCTGSGRSRWRPPKKDFVFGVALRYRYKRDLHNQPRVTPPQNVDYGKHITGNVTTNLYIHGTLRAYVYVKLRVHAPQRKWTNFHWITHKTHWIKPAVPNPAKIDALLTMLHVVAACSKREAIDQARGSEEAHTTRVAITDSLRSVMTAKPSVSKKTRRRPIYFLGAYVAFKNTISLYNQFFHQFVQQEYHFIIFRWFHLQRFGLFGVLLGVVEFLRAVLGFLLAF